MKIENELKKRSVNGLIKESEAVKVGAEADQVVEQLVEMLEQCKKQLGMFMGGEISQLLGKVKGVRFNEKEYHHERMPDGQD